QDFFAARRIPLPDGPVPAGSGQFAGPGSGQFLAICGEGDRCDLNLVPVESTNRFVSHLLPLAHSPAPCGWGQSVAIMQSNLMTDPTSVLSELDVSFVILLCISLLFDRDRVKGFKRGVKNFLRFHPTVCRQPDVKPVGTVARSNPLEGM